MHHGTDCGSEALNVDRTILRVLVNHLMACRAMVGMAIVASVVFVSLAPQAVAARPSKLLIIEGIARIDNAKYDQGTSDALTSPAAGQGDLVLSIASKEFSKPGVRFSNLLSDASGRVTGLAVVLADAFTVTNIIGAGTGLTIPKGQLTYEAPARLKISGQATLTLPFRNSAGERVQAFVKSVGGVMSPGKTTVSVDGIALKGAPDGLSLPGIKVQSSQLSLEVTWAQSSAVEWQLKAATAAVAFGLPGQATDPECPIKASATNLTIDQDGQVKFRDASVTNSSAFKLPELAGFDLVVKKGTVSMDGYLPSFSGLTFDVTLPTTLFRDDQGKPVTLTNLSVQTGQGLVVNSAKGVPCRLGNQSGPLLKIDDLSLDFSSSTSAIGAPSGATNPSWMGIYIKKGNLQIGVGGRPLTFSCENFMIGPQGASGKATLKADSSGSEIGGFSLKGLNGNIELLFNQIKSATVSGNLDLGPLGANISAGVHFDLNGKVAFSIKPGSSLSIPNTPLSISNLKVRTDSSLLSFSGDMNIGTIDEFKFPSIAVTGFKVDKSGRFHLPEAGMITFPDPKPMNLGPLGVELRQFGFTTDNNKIASIRFSAGASLKEMEDILPGSGAIDFEGFEIVRKGNDWKVEIGGVEFDAEVLGIGKLHASLHSTRDGNFGECLYGDAQLKLTCLGDMPVGIGLEFLAAPKYRENGTPAPAFFVGGNVTIPQPILVQIPPTPPNPSPVPLFHIMGFSGGFGFNVAPKAAGVGRISDPLVQLKPQAGTVLLQAGLLLADPVPGSPGHLWWADAALTLTINPVTVDLTARAVFLDTGSPAFLSLEEWQNKDRWARIYINLDFAKPALTIGGDADLTFPTRKTSVLSMSGEAELRAASDEAYLRIGWKKAGQKPLKVEVAEAFSEVADISGKCGIQVVMPVFAMRNNQLKVINTTSTSMYFDLRAKFEIKDVARLRARFKGALELEIEPGGEFRASGELSLAGKADFGIFVASANGDIKAYFNKGDHKKEFYVSGEIRASVGEFKTRANLDQKLLAWAN